MYARNEMDPGKVRNKYRQSPIVISDESMSGRHYKNLLSRIVADLRLVYTYHQHQGFCECYVETKPRDYIEPIFTQYKKNSDVNSTSRWKLLEYLLMM